MDFDDFDQLQGAILDCVERHIGGRDERTRRRREAIVAFFDRVVLLHGSERPAIDVMLDDLEAVMTLYWLALQNHSPTDVASQAAYAEVRRLADEIAELFRQLESGHPQPFSVQEEVACLRVLQEVFTWEPTERLRAYVFAETGEVLQDGLLGKERSELLVQVRRCAEELLK